MKLFILMVVLSQKFGPVQSLTAKSSTVGKDFYFGILPVYNNAVRDAGNIITIDVTNVSPQDVQIRLQIPYLHNDSSHFIPPGQNKTFRIPPQFQEQGTHKDFRGIRITSDGDASVIVSNRYNNSNGMDVYNVLPITSIGKRYVIASYRGYVGMTGSIFIATGVTNDTTLTVYKNGTSHSVHLDALEVYQYLCDLENNTFCDMSGTLLVSDKNIEVTAGSTWSSNSIRSSYGDTLASEMIPTSAWTSSYIVPPLYPMPGFIFRVMSEYDSLIMLSNTTYSFSSKADLSEMYFGNLPVLALSNQAFSVYQYGFSYNEIGDQFMAAVPGIKQYINDYVFMVPRAFYGNTRSYIALIVPLEMKDTLMLDGQSVQSRLTSVGDIIQLSVPPPFNNYTVLTFQTTEGIHHFWHPQRDVTFGVFVYGLGQHMGYGFYAGYNLQGKEEITADMATTTETSSHAVTNDLDETTIAFMSEGHMCYQCNDLTHPDLCDTVHKCASSEVCFVKMFSESGQRKFRSGCLGSDMCQANMNNAHHSNELCFDCCYSDYCNNKGCGEAGMPDRNSRGPVCFDCQHVSSPAECHKVTPCEKHQVCRIEENKWFEHSHFKMGCGDSLCDPVARVLPISHVMKRATPVCYVCCSDDYCNKNCTNQNWLPNGPNIIG